MEGQSLLGIPALAEHVKTNHKAARWGGAAALTLGSKENVAVLA